VCVREYRTSILFLVGPRTERALKLKRNDDDDDADAGQRDNIVRARVHIAVTCGNGAVRG